MQDDRNTNLSIEDHFEHVLKRISVQAFDALLTCGVRDVGGLLRLTEEGLHQFRIPSNIFSELMDVQKQINDHITNVVRETDDSEYVVNESDFMVDQQHVCSNNDFADDHSDQTITASTIDTPTGPSHDCRYPRIRFVSVDCEIFPSTPADWSILSQTLPQLCGVNFTFNNIDYASKISTLGLNATDIDHLCNINIFPEDPTDFLYTITTGYLLQSNISDEAISIVHDHLSQHTFGSIVLCDLPTHVSNTPIFADMQTKWFESFIIHKFPYPDLFTSNMPESKAMVVSPFY